MEATVVLIIVSICLYIFHEFANRRQRVTRETYYRIYYQYKSVHAIMLGVRNEITQDSALF